jgi:hypothetical protein
MKEEEIKKKIELAEKSVADIKDENLRVKAFEVILNNLLSGKVVTPTIKLTAVPKQTITEQKELKFEPEKLASALEVELERLRNIIDFSDDDFHIIVNIPGNTDSDKQKNSALIILTIRYYCLGDREIPSNELRNRMRDLGIGSLINMASNLNSIRNFIIRCGKPRSPATRYRITDPGIREGLRLLKQLLQKSESQAGESAEDETDDEPK